MNNQVPKRIESSCRESIFAIKFLRKALKNK